MEYKRIDYNNRCLTHPDIDFWARVLLSFENLWGGIRRTAAPRCQEFALGVVIGKAEVGYLDVHVGIQ